MRVTSALLVLAGCGNPEPAPRAVTHVEPVVIAPADDTMRACKPGEAPTGEWRFALTAGPFEPTLDITRARFDELWRAGKIAASAETAALLGRERVAADAAWSIVPAHELSPARSVITVDGTHPLLADSPARSDGPLAVPTCGRAARNIDPAKLTTVVMSGTTALTGRTAKRIDTHGAANLVEHIAPFFRSADVTHVSNEVAFVKRCKPSSGQDELIFCSRDSYIDVLDALGVDIVELTGSHLTDYGDRALRRTIDMYEQRGWMFYGGGRTQIDATAPRVVEHNGNRLAFIGCNAVNTWVRHLSRGYGTAACDWARLKWQLQDLRRGGFFPIATVQHRELREHAPPPDLVADLRGLAEAGARVVIGSQAHVAHPWDVHHGAYLHYGPGNLLFAQYRKGQREAAADKLYIHDNRLLAVEHIYVRTEKGRPRPLRDDERSAFLGRLADAAAAIAPPSPDAEPQVPPEPRERPDSLLVRGRNQYLSVTLPAAFDPARRYAAVIDIDGTLAPRDDAFHVRRLGKPYRTEHATGAEISDYVRAKYPVDAVEINETKPRRRRR